MTRGYGTHLAFDVKSPEWADLVQKFLFRNGILVLKCGPQTLGLRPSLTLDCDDAAQLRDALYHFHPDF